MEDCYIVTFLNHVVGLYSGPYGFAYFTRFSAGGNRGPPIPTGHSPSTPRISWPTESLLTARLYMNVCVYIILITPMHTPPRFSFQLSTHMTYFRCSLIYTAGISCQRNHQKMLTRFNMKQYLRMLKTHGKRCQCSFTWHKRGVPVKVQRIKKAYCNTRDT